VPIAGFSTGEQMYVFHSTEAFDDVGTQGGLDVFWQGADHAIASAWANPGVDGGRWREPFPITPPGAASATPSAAAVTRLEGALDVFWIGDDRAIWTTWANPMVDGGTWHPPFQITPAQAAGEASVVAAVTRLKGALDVFWVGPDRAVWTTWASPEVDNGTWHSPFAITHPAAARASSQVAVVTRFAGALDVFWVGDDRAIWTTWANPEVDNGAWHDPFPITRPGAAGDPSSVAAVTRLDGALDVFWVGDDRAIWTTWANPEVDNGTWHDPFSIAPAGAAGPASSVAALTRLEGALDVFWVGHDRGVWTTWANPEVDNGGWYPPFAITPQGSAYAASSVAAVTRLNGGRSTLMGRTVLAEAVDNDPTRLQALYTVSRLAEGGRFINVSVHTVGGWAGLPFEGPALIVFGSGRYRQSDVFLACVPLGEVRRPEPWRFFCGTDGHSSPLWSPEERDAVPLFHQPQVGELSVSWVEPIGRWLMLYNALSPRGINGRVAESPWGPWSEPELVFDPSWDGVGYGVFMHRKDVEDGLEDPRRFSEDGGEYGPYLIDRFTRAAPGRAAQVYFVMSTWNPYNTVLMTATVELT
jgi:hypothetical protein